MCQPAFESAWGVCVCTFVFVYILPGTKCNSVTTVQAHLATALKAHWPLCWKNHRDNNQSQESSQHRLGFSTQSNPFIATLVLLLLPRHVVLPSMWGWHSRQGERSYYWLMGLKINGWLANHYKFCLCKSCMTSALSLRVNEDLWQAVTPAPQHSVWTFKQRNGDYSWWSASNWTSLTY